MTRWSRRWAAGERTKDQLREILEEISKRKDWPGGSMEQLIGDHYCSCMDEARVNAVGAAPLLTWFGDVDKMKNPGDVQKMIARMHEVGVARTIVHFDVRIRSTRKEPSVFWTVTTGWL